MSSGHPSSQRDTSKPTIALIGFLDTKLDEHTLVYERLVALGCDVKVIDVSTKVSLCSPRLHP
ncbi:hypothetical protein DL93DRAFT_2084127 [Clavulina sp. PMI_390]|nr:hypothetical protein DL93DRAFT_2084127 [Clavulina sp. PMI_390]